MKLFFLFFSLFLISVLSIKKGIKGVCFDPNRGLALSLDCKNIQIYRVGKALCFSFKSDVLIPLDSIKIKIDPFKSSPIFKELIKEKCGNLTIESLGDSTLEFRDILPDLYINDFVFLGIFDSSQEIKNSKDGTTQFFDEGDMKDLIAFDSGANPPAYTTKDLTESLKNPNFTCSDDLKFEAVKLYWRYSGCIPKDQIYPIMQGLKKDLNSSRTSAPNFKQTLQGGWYLKTFKKNAPQCSKDVNGFAVKHEILEVCGGCGEGKKHKFLIERTARTALNLWNSKVTLYYSGNSDNCSLESNDWGDVKGGNYEDENGKVGPQLRLRAQWNQTFHGGLNDFLDKSMKYIKNYPKYNFLYNCQHYATNLYNIFTGNNLEFESQDLMGNKESIPFEVA